MNKYLVKPNKKFRLSNWDADDTSGLSGKEEADRIMEKLRGELTQLQRLLYAEHKRKVLIVLQGMDTSGKDGTIRLVFEGVNPQGVRVNSFVVPTRLESDRDYLWRVHLTVPAKGQIVIFNRSHYEDVLTVRVHDTFPEKVWRKRYGHIRDFERMLSDEGTVVLKFFLHISKDEQKRRLEKRLDNPEKNWKFKESDVQERKFWDKYMKAYNEAMAETSTDYAPWYVVPANNKWYRNWVIASTIVDTLKTLKMKYPIPEWNTKKKIRIP